MKLKSTDRICLFRSAFIGDWIVTLPFYCYLIYECKVPKENIYSIIINKNGANPIKMVLGEISILCKNSSVVNSKGLIKTLESAIKIRKEKKYRSNKVILLPFTSDNGLSNFKKLLISYLTLGFSGKRYGFTVFKNKQLHLSVSQYISYFNKLGIEYNQPKRHIEQFLNSEGITIPEFLQKELLKIAIYPHSKLKMKIWNLNNFVTLINRLHNKYPAEFLLIGSVEDYEYNEFLHANLSPQIKVKNLAGKLSIRQTFIELASCDLLIANDGAPIHFASILNVPIVAIFTYKEPVGAWDPFLSSKFISHRTDVLCKHCFKEECPNPVCINLISVDDVFKSSCELLENRELDCRQNKISIPPQSVHFEVNN